ARVLIKSQKRNEALTVYREMLIPCGPALDDAGMPFSFYAADRLIELKLDVPLAEDYLIGAVRAVRLRPLSQMYMIRSLLRTIGSAKANEAFALTTSQIRDFEQTTALGRELRDVQAQAGNGWLGYGEEPWLLRWRPASGSAPPLLFAVSSRKLAPAGTK